MLQRWRLAAALLALVALLLGWPAARAEPAAAPASSPAPLVIGHRTVHTFRVPLGAFSPADRADAARHRFAQALAEGGQGWISVRQDPAGVLVELDGRPMFVVAAGDQPPGGTSGADQLANAAARVLNTAWREAQERQNPRASLRAVGVVLAAAVALVVTLLGVWRATRWARDTVTRVLAQRMQAMLPDAALARRMAPLLLGIASRSCVLAAWLISLLALFVFLATSLDQFAHTRALGEGMFQAFADLVLQGLASLAAALPGLFVAALIFLVAWICTQFCTELFQHVASGWLKLGALDAHTAPATRRIVNACLWLFALAMAYPYLPGAQTEAFKGLTVIVGIMVSIGASGLLGQVASGVILVYTRALSLGEYVRIQDCEGTVTEIGLTVTRLRTGTGAECALPNALVLGNVTRNFSREVSGRGHVLETAVTIGYDTPWRQVQALLLEAAATVPDIASQPAPFVLQTALSDFYVAYKLVVVVMPAQPARRARAASALNAAILDTFNRYGVQIMSPGYYEDPARPKLVPESQWYAAPARRPEGS